MDVNTMSGFSSKFLSYGPAASQVWGLPNLFLALQTPAFAPAHPGGTNKDQWRLALLHNCLHTSSEEPWHSL